MIAPYNCVGLIPTVWGIRTRADIMKNIEHLGHLTKAAAWLSRLDIPVRLLVIPEGGLQGFNDEVLDLDHVEFANNCAIDIPGPETQALGKLAREYDVFIMAQAKAKHPDWKDRFFNVGFVLDPKGEVILKHYKLATLYPVEHSMTPHDVFDWWIEKYGRTLDAFWPVVDTEIGRLGVMMANEASYPENGRGLAMNGCEIAYRASFPHPGTGNDFFEISSRARALENNMYVLSPNMGTYYLFPDFDDADRYLRRALVHRQPPRRHRRKAGIRRRLDLCRRRHRRRAAAASSSQRAGFKLDEGCAHRTGSDHLRPRDLSEEPLPRPRADEARGIQGEGHRPPDRAHAGHGRLEEANGRREAA